MRLVIGNCETNIKIYETNIKTPKAILCKVYSEYVPGFESMWIPKSQIFRKEVSYSSDESIIELNPWFLGKAFTDLKIYIKEK